MIKLTHPERILWPESGITKQGLADYYAEIADWILPHVAGRVVSLVRHPSGIGTKGFFAKHPWAGLSNAVQRIDVGEAEPMLAIDGIAGLMDFVQAGVIEIHPWGSRVERLEAPDRLIFDLDPGEDVPWSAVIAAAQEVRLRLDDRGLASFVKTSGGKGLHVVVPIAPEASWDAAKAFTASLAATMAAARSGSLCGDHGQARPPRPHLCRLFAQRSRCDGGCSLFPTRPAASFGLDAAGMGRTIRWTAGRSFYHSQPAS